jgi:hypothetical protein
LEGNDAAVMIGAISGVWGGDWNSYNVIDLETSENLLSSLQYQHDGLKIQKSWNPMKNLGKALGKL